MSRARPEASAIALRAFLLAVAAAAVAGLSYILGVVREEAWLLSAGVVAGACLLVFLQAWIADRGRHRAWMRLGMASTAGSAALGIACVWFPYSMMEVPLRIGLALLAIGVWIAWGGVLAFSRVGGAAISSIRWGTFALVAAWGTVAVVACIDPETSEQFIALVVGPNLFGRALASSVVIALAGTIAQPILVLLVRRSAQSSDPRLGDRHLAVEFRCPRCGTMPAIEANTDALCPGCRLAIRVVVDEPRCGCGFLLYRLEASNCPECGSAVPESLRWRAPVTTSPASTPSP